MCDLGINSENSLNIDCEQVFAITFHIPLLKEL